MRKQNSSEREKILHTGIVFLVISMQDPWSLTFWLGAAFQKNKEEKKYDRKTLSGS